jgi:acyl-coenzyme A thioesterase PaaI-like protein
LAKGWVEKKGARIHFCESEVYAISENGQKTVFAKATASMLVLEDK